MFALIHIAFFFLITIIVIIFLRVLFFSGSLTFDLAFHTLLPPRARFGGEPLHCAVSCLERATLRELLAVLPLVRYAASSGLVSATRVLASSRLATEQLRPR